MYPWTGHEVPMLSRMSGCTPFAHAYSAGIFPSIQVKVFSTVVTQFFPNLSAGTLERSPSKK